LIAKISPFILFELYTLNRKFLLDKGIKRVDSKLKVEVEEILGEIGLTTSQVINIFLKAITRERGIPVSVCI